MSDLIHIDGKPFVLVPVHEYRRLMAASGDGFTEKSDLPQELLDLIAAGQWHPVKLVRKFRGMTQKDLAEAAGISRPYLTEIETRRKSGSIAALKTLALTLRVPVGLLLQDGVGAPEPDFPESMASSSPLESSA